MKQKTDISQYIQNFDYELESTNDWLNAHINIMFIEIHEIINTVYIFKTVQNEWNKRVENNEKINYSPIRTILFESLPYKIILGLSKIFVGKQEYSLPKTINTLSQLDEYKNNNKLKSIIIKIYDYINTCETIKIITTFRDQYYAHLDKICAISDCRIDPTIPISKLDLKEINKGAELIGELYEVCFNTKLDYPNKKISEQDVIYTFFWDSLLEI